MAKRPIFGVTGPVSGGAFAWTMTRLALKRVGAGAVRITPKTRVDIRKLSGLVLGGGSDIDPENYGETLLQLGGPEPEAAAGDRVLGLLLFLFRVLFSVKTSQPTKDEARDELETKLCRYALKHGLPVLGICRGAQLINVAMGGSLYQDTAMFYTETPHIKTILPKKRVYLVQKSLLHTILGVDTCRVNSLHDQAIQSLGEGLVITASDKNGIVQAIEHLHHSFMIGVQWHPEYLPQSKRQQRLFQALARAATSV